LGSKKERLGGSPDYKMVGHPPVVNIPPFKDFPTNSEEPCAQKPPKNLLPKEAFSQNIPPNPNIGPK